MYILCSSSLGKSHFFLSGIAIMHRYDGPVSEKEAHATKRGIISEILGEAGFLRRSLRLLQMKREIRSSLDRTVRFRNEGPKSRLRTGRTGARPISFGVLNCYFIFGNFRLARELPTMKYERLSVSPLNVRQTLQQLREPPIRGQQIMNRTLPQRQRCFRDIEAIVAFFLEYHRRFLHLSFLEYPWRKENNVFPVFFYFLTAC